MAIKFVCSCGKRLRARDEMAARRSLCPACGEPVGIPSLQPTARGATAGPMTPAERLSARRRVVTADALLPDASRTNANVELTLPQSTVDPPADAGTDAIAELLLTKIHRESDAPTSPPHRRGKPTWYDALVFQFPTAVPVLFHGLTLPAVFFGTLWLLRVQLHHEGVALPVLIAINGLFLLLPLSLAGSACSFLDSVFHAPPGHDAARRLLQPSRDIGPALRSSVVWLTCFLAGPVLPATLAALFGLYGGVFSWIDWLIEAELLSLTVSYWLFALISVHQKDQLRDLSPIRIADLVHRLGYRASILAGLASGFALVHAGVLLMFELDWLALAGVCLSGMICATFLFRLAGLWCQHKPVA